MEVLILSCSTGGGHNSAGYAIKEELESRGHSVKMFDPYKLINNKNIDKKLGGLYLKVVRHTPKLFGCLYKMGELYSKTSLRSPVYLANAKMEKPLIKYLENHHFDAIVMTHLFPGQMVTNLKEKGVKLPKTVYIATDYTCIPFTEEIDADYYIVPAKKVVDDFVSKGVDKERIVPLGIPVKKPFYQNDKPKSDENHYILLSSGSIGLNKMQKATKILLRYLKRYPKCNLVVVCGGNKTLYRKLNFKYKSNKQLKLVFKTDKMAEYMRNCDVFITKPGGLSSTEAAVLGIPTIHIIPIPGCESINIKLFDSLGLSIGLGNDLESLPIALESLKCKEAREAMIKSQHKEINQYSTIDICDFLEKIVK